MKDDCQIANLKARVAELESVRDDLSRAYAVQGLALEEERDRVAELEAENLILQHQVEDLRSFAKVCTNSAKTILGVPLK